MDKAKLNVVLGGSGFLGQPLCRSLVAAGARVRSVSRSGHPKGQAQLWWQSVDWTAAAIGTESCARALEGADCVFHLASTTLPSNSNANMVHDLESNVVATVRTLEDAATIRIRRFVFVSSGGTVYGMARRSPIAEDHPTDPICSYGIHKLTIEKYLQLFRFMDRLDSVVLRVANAYGESQDRSRPLGAVAHFTARAVEGTPLEIWGDGKATRDYVHVEDIARALLTAASYQGHQRLFNIGSGRSIALNQIVEMLRQRLPGPVTVNYLPARGFDVQENVLDNSRARNELLWAPEVAFETGLERMIRAVQRETAGS
jgi:UDP-glucose 4-epimerase